MNLSGKNRIQTITELVTRLFEQPPPVKAVKSHQQDQAKEQPRDNSHAGGVQPAPPQNYPPQGNYPPPPPPPRYYDKQENDYDDYRYEKVNTVDRLKVPIIIAILLLAILLIIVVFFMQAFAPDVFNDDPEQSSSSVSENIVTDPNSEPETEPEVKPDTEVPDLVNKFYSLCETKYADYFKFDVEYIFDNESDPDVILEQDPEAGTMIPQGSIIKLTVSKGKEGAIIPDYSGLTVSQYENRLKEAGITNFSLIPSNTGYGYPDTISQLQVGGKIVKAGEYFSNKDGDKLNVYYIPKDAQVSPPQTQQYVQETTPAAVTTAAYVPPPPAQTEPPATEPPVVDPPVVDPPVVDPPPVDDPDPGNNGDEVGTW